MLNRKEERASDRMIKQIFYNGTIVTMEREGEEVEAVYVEDGIMKEVGEWKKIKERKQDVEYVDLNGQMMLPAFLDAHSHITQFAGIL